MCYCSDVDPTTKRVVINAAYFGEFGYELALHVPYTHYLRSLGALNATAGPVGSAALHPYSPHHTELRRLKRRGCFGPPTHADAHPDVFSLHQYLPPDYNALYRQLATKGPLSRDPLFAPRAPRPGAPAVEPELLIIHNKYASEWGGPPVNFLDLATLHELFAMLQDRYQVVYINPGSRRREAARARLHDVDESDPITHHDLGDIELLDKFSRVQRLQQVYQRHAPGISYNRLLFAVHARCRRFISVQGGNSVMASYFGGTNIVYAVQGAEMRGAHNDYTKFYRHFSNATVLHTRSYSALLRHVRKHYLGQDPGPATRDDAAPGPGKT